MAALTLAMRESTTVASAKVETSPNLSSSPATIFRKMRRIILPLRVYDNKNSFRISF